MLAAGIDTFLGGESLEAFNLFDEGCLDRLVEVESLVRIILLMRNVTICVSINVYLIVLCSISFHLNFLI